MACPFSHSRYGDPAVHFEVPTDTTPDSDGTTDTKSILAWTRDGAVTTARKPPQNKAAAAAFPTSQLNYGEYLQLDKLLACQRLRSVEEGGQMVPDEHLFIIIHQTYELWFKQVIFDVDGVRRLLHHRVVDETKTLQIVQLLERTVRILKLLVDQMLILETMSPLDFVEFRKYLTSASGFQSIQFRLLENKLGVIGEHRVRYNAQHYTEVFSDECERQMLRETEQKEPSLFVLIDRWLSRTPGIYDMDEEGGETCYGALAAAEISNLPAGADNAHSQKISDPTVEANGTHSTPTPTATTLRKDTVASVFSIDDELSPTVKKRNNFWNRYLEAVTDYLHDMRTHCDDEKLSEEERCQKRAEYMKMVKSFESITDEREYQSTVEKGERRLSHNALKGALMIYFYRDMPRFHCAYMILTFLMDVDSLLQKWRYNHVMLVQRMLGNKQGSGGSSGYLYLRTTVSDRYKVFLDLFNLSTWLIPRAYIPPLSAKMVKTLSEHSHLADSTACIDGSIGND